MHVCGWLFHVCVSKSIYEYLYARVTECKCVCPCVNVCGEYMSIFTYVCKTTGVGCHSLLQGIFQSQGLNLGLLHCRGIL